MKKTAFVFFLTLYSFFTFASHITGGEMTYEYLGPGTQPNTRKILITLKLFRDETTTGAPMPSSVFIGIFNNDNDSQFPGFNQPYIVPITSERPVNVDPYPPCVKNATVLNYHVGLYSLTVELPVNIAFTATYQTCCRINPLHNVFTTDGSGGTGSTYTCVIPRIIDSSPKFAGSVDLICQKREFTLNFTATDPDGDSLVYSFVNAYNGGEATNANNINPAEPPYSPVSYLNAFSGNAPMGNQVRINPLTGIISGIAPVAGRYVVSVQVTSYKKGIYASDHRKDFIVNVGDCDVPGATLNLKPVTCDGYTVTFSNDNPSPLNKTFFWDFGDPKSGDLNTSTLANPTHFFSDTGIFVYKLVINRNQPCSDSTTQVLKVYPGFRPGFTVTGQCKNTPIQFTDTTKSRYGTVNSWSWNFVDPQRTDDSSHRKNPTYVFTASDNYNVQLIVGDNKGCIDTTIVSVAVKDKPDFTVTNDTLICSIDTLQLNAVGAGTFSWTPGYSISSQTIAAPLVSPDVPTKYFVNFSDAFGCKGSDSVFVDVKRTVTLSIGRDTAICLTDALVLSPESDALHYKWSPSGSLNNDTLKNPTAVPLVNTNYTLVASIGKCQAADEIMVKVAPYPRADAGSDSTICFGSAIQLKASGGTLYNWSPSFFLSDPGISNPVAFPVNDISYIVSVSDTLGCSKRVTDSIRVRVLKVTAEAGPSDTIVVVNQPLRLKASGGEFYTWSPPTGLSDPNTNDPVAVLSNSQRYVLKVSQSGCSDTDTINVRVYKIEPGLYVPNAFTPNNDGVNDVFRPIPVGMKTIAYFRIYNRWGKLMFSSPQIGKGWDGSFDGRAQDPAVYVWMIEGTDYLDRKVSKKGSLVLIR